jgi:hypothetical protein
MYVFLAKIIQKGYDAGDTSKGPSLDTSKTGWIVQLIGITENFI